MRPRRLTNLDRIFFREITATPPPFRLRAGRHTVVVTATDWTEASATLRQVAADGSRSAAREFTADGYAVLDLAAGEYELVVSGPTRFFASLNRLM